VTLDPEFCHPEPIACPELAEGKSDSFIDLFSPPYQGGDSGEVMIISTLFLGGFNDPIKTNPTCILPLVRGGIIKFQSYM
jgi:hypothetical protein